jgi:phosphate transport system substrate-binding protein
MMASPMLFVVASLLFAVAQSADAVVECGPSGGRFSIAGSSTVFPIAETWAKHYMMMCPDINITVEAGGSGAGASRVCASDKNGGTPVDIGDMSRHWFEKEALASPNGYLYQCVIGEGSRSVIQVDVAIDGLSIAVAKNGTAAACIETIGGLSTDQLRWIYTNYGPDDLLATGWDSSSITNSDGNPDTHLWSEIDARCENTEIIIAGADPVSGTFEFFLENILIDLDNGETFDPNRPKGYFNSSDDEDIVKYTEADGAVVAFFGYAYYLKDSGLLLAVPIKNDEGNFIVPTPETVSDGTYNPFSRRLFMNLLNDAESLDNTRPFIQYGFSPNGTALVDETGYVAIDESERQILLETLPAQGESLYVAPLPSPTTGSVETLSSPSAAQPSVFENSNNESGSPQRSNAFVVSIAAIAMAAAFWS